MCSSDLLKRDFGGRQICKTATHINYSNFVSLSVSLSLYLSVFSQCVTLFHYLYIYLSLPLHSSLLIFLFSSILQSLQTFFFSFTSNIAPTFLFFRSFTTISIANCWGEVRYHLKLKLFSLKIYFTIFYIYLCTEQTYRTVFL